MARSTTKIMTIKNEGKYKTAIWMVYKKALLAPYVVNLHIKKAQ